MRETIQQFIEGNSAWIIRATLSILILITAYLAARIYRRYISETAKRHEFAAHRSNNISKVGQVLIYFISILIISNVLGFGIQGIFLATSSFFAIVGVAFFATWSVLSNVTASLLLYFTFPYRIGDRILIDNEPNHSGKLTDVTLMYMKIQTDGGSYVTLPANVAIQKVITVQSETDYQKMLKEKEEEKDGTV